MSDLPRPRSPLTIVVLALTCEEPMHPYRMQTLIKQRGKDQIANVSQRNSVYQTIDSLCRAGLIAVRGTSQESRRPERTVYEGTQHGRLALKSWIRTGLSTPAREFPEFPAVLATMYGVEGAADLAVLLATRVKTLKDRLAGLEAPVPGVPRLFLLEAEYMAAVVRAECKWLESITTELHSARLVFPTEAEIQQMSAELGPPSANAVRDYAKQHRASRASGGTLNTKASLAHSDVVNRRKKKSARRKNGSLGKPKSSKRR